jgi:hypothetical protein
MTGIKRESFLPTRLHAIAPVLQNGLARGCTTHNMEKQGSISVEAVVISESEVVPHVA